MPFEWSYSRSLTILTSVFKESGSHHRWSYNHLLLYVLNINNDARPSGCEIPISVFFFINLHIFYVKSMVSIIYGITTTNIVINLVLYYCNRLVNTMEVCVCYTKVFSSA